MTDAGASKGGGNFPPPAEYRFKPGKSGNPGGKCKNAVSLKAHLQRIIEEEKRGRPVAGGAPGQTNFDAVARKLVVCAIQGKSWAQRIVWDRLEGRVPLNLIHGSDGTNPPTLELIIRRETADDEAPSE